MAKSILKSVYCVIVITITFWSCSDQKIKQDNDLTLPDFSFIGLSEPLIDRENVKVSVHVKIPYTELQFIREGDSYLARYEISANILDASNERIEGKIWSDSLLLQSYQDTRNTDETALSVKTFIVPAEELSLTVRVTDLYTKKSRILKDKLDHEKMFQGELALGNLMIMENYSSEKDVVLMGQSFYEVVDTLNFKARIVGLNHPYKISYELIVKEESQKSDSFVLEHDGPIDSLLSFTIPLNDLQYTNYTLFLTAEDAANNRVATKSHFRVRLKGINYDVGDIDEAIKQLVYIAGEKTVYEIMAGTNKDKTERFESFWTNLDPSPGTTDNELMEEYYRRVAFSIEAFTVVQDGWKSDRGMIYILYGPPDEIQRGPFELDQKPYQVWEYFRLGKQFVFRDRTGFGEYTLDYSYINDNDWRFNY